MNLKCPRLWHGGGQPDLRDLEEDKKRETVKVDMALVSIDDRLTKYYNCGVTTSIK